MLTTLFADGTLATVLAAIAAFAAVAAFALPGTRHPRHEARLRMVARERGQLREARLAELSSQTKAKLRLEAHSALKRLGAALKASNPFGAGDITARLRMAGLRGPEPEAVFLFLRAATPIAFFALSLAVLLLRPGSQISPGSALLLAVGAGAIGFGLPRFVLARLIARRQTAILRGFPDALDLLLICVQAGMSVEAALARVTKDIACQSIELAEELSLTMAELAYLPSRWRAYHNLGERTGLPAVKLIAAALAQAERLGTSIGQALTAAADECRAARLTEAERKAAALPPKLTIPLVVFFLPILLAAILTPAILNMRSALRESGGYFTQRLEPRRDARSGQNARPAQPGRETPGRSAR